MGTYVARWLVANTDRDIIALVRSEDGASAEDRLARAWWDRPELAEVLGTRIRAAAGDVAQVRLGLDDKTLERAIKEVDTIVHVAADIRLNAPLDELRRTNVEGVRNVLALAEEIDRDHGFQRLSHVSTAYVAGGRKGPVAEEDLTDEHGFLSNYERSKYEGEVLVQEAKGRLPVSVFRPGMVVGSSEDGYVRTFNTLYYPLRLYLTGRLRVLPLSSSQRINLVPVDRAAEAIGRLTFDPRAVGLNFHLVGGKGSLPTVGELVDLTRAWARDRLGVRLPRPVYLPAASGLLRTGRGPEEGLAALAPYLREEREFRRDNLDRLLGPDPTDWRTLLPRLLEFGAYTGFLHRTERTVHEQVLFRLKGQRRPVRLFDVVDGAVIERPATEVRGDMVRAAAALRALGIVKGDRVAIVGSNSVRYLVLDVALGLVGAVSVPLYYTSPPGDLDALIEDSGARLVLMGSTALLKRVPGMRTAVPIISFARSVPEEARGRTMPWEEFLSKGDGDERERSPVGFGAPATLRYTSGTTGEAKGVLFRHGQLRFMAESTASLPPWTARTSEVFYLSYLPMNHVVEGILAIYSPFYAPSPINLYFLEDFKGLQKALPLVRPTVFFSVPRFYEKFWNGLMANRLARSCLAGNGAGRAVLSPLVRKKALQAAGLDRCAYLISGSGPMGQEMLEGFHSLGIEVHDAYGLTEAPLVTINRPGRNRIGTVGEPLPRTEVSIAEDGEVLVKGPQVTCCYDGGEQPFRDGWLLTGDYGRLTKDGSLVLEGRKKELIKTAYGKFVNPQKVETMLRDLPGVAEAMLVGEGRPFCTALIWVEKGKGPDLAALDRRIEDINSRLSRPEQVRAWAVLPNTLSVDGGELTANLKLRRARVLERHNREIEGLYTGTSEGDEALHLGKAGREA